MCDDSQPSPSQPLRPATSNGSSSPKKRRNDSNTTSNSKKLRSAEQAGNASTSAVAKPTTYENRPDEDSSSRVDRESTVDTCTSKSLEHAQRHGTVYTRPGCCTCGTNMNATEQVEIFQAAHILLLIKSDAFKRNSTTHLTRSQNGPEGKPQHQCQSSILCSDENSRARRLIFEEDRQGSGVWNTVSKVDWFPDKHAPTSCSPDVSDLGDRAYFRSFTMDAASLCLNWEKTSSYSEKENNRNSRNSDQT